jgi:hypothetical protein
VTRESATKDDTAGDTRDGVNPAEDRKRYSPPELRRLGKVTELTQGVGGSNFDAGQNSNSKVGAG